MKWSHSSWHLDFIFHENLGRMFLFENCKLLNCPCKRKPEEKVSTIFKSSLCLVHKRISETSWTMRSSIIHCSLVAFDEDVIAQCSQWRLQKSGLPKEEKCIHKITIQFHNKDDITKILPTVEHLPFIFKYFFISHKMQLVLCVGNNLKNF